MATKYCPHCEELTETRVIEREYTQIHIQGGIAKRRKIIHRVEDGGCGKTWTTLEIPENILRRLSPGLFYRPVHFWDSNN